MPSARLAEFTQLLLGGAVFLGVLVVGQLVSALGGGDEESGEAPRREARAAPPRAAPDPQPSPSPAPPPPGGATVRAFPDLFPPGEAMARPEFLEVVEAAYRTRTADTLRLRCLGPIRVSDLRREPGGFRVGLRLACVHEGPEGELLQRLDDLEVTGTGGGAPELGRIQPFHEEALAPYRPLPDPPDSMPASISQEDLSGQLAGLRRDQPGFSLLEVQEEVRGLYLDLHLARAQGSLGDLSAVLEPRVRELEQFWLQRQQGLGQRWQLDELHVLGVDLVRIERGRSGPVLTFHVVASARAYLLGPEGQLLRGNKDAGALSSEYWTLVPDPSGALPWRVGLIEAEDAFYAWDRGMRKDAVGGPDPSPRVHLEDRAMPRPDLFGGSMMGMMGRRGGAVAMQRLQQFRATQQAQLAQLEMDASAQMLALAGEAGESRGPAASRLTALREKVPDLCRLEFYERLARMVGEAHRGRDRGDWSPLGSRVTAELRGDLEALPQLDSVVGVHVHKLFLETVDPSRAVPLVIARCLVDVLAGDPQAPARVRHEHRLSLEYRGEDPNAGGWWTTGLKSLETRPNPEPVAARRPVRGLAAGRARFDPEVELQKAATLAEEGLPEVAASMEAFVLRALDCRRRLWQGDEGAGAALAEVFHPLLAEAEGDRVRQVEERRLEPLVGLEELEGIDLVRLEDDPPRPGFTLRLVTRGPPTAGVPRGPVFSEYWTLSRPRGWRVDWIESDQDYVP